MKKAHGISWLENTCIFIGAIFATIVCGILHIENRWKEFFVYGAVFICCEVITYCIIKLIIKLIRKWTGKN